MSSFYESMYLRETIDSFVVYSTEDEKSSLHIDKVQNRSRLTHDNSNFNDAAGDSMNNLKIYGVIGSIKLLAGNHLIVITDKSPIGLDGNSSVATELNEHTIWCATKFAVLPYYGNQSNMSDTEKSVNETYKKMLEQFLNTQYFYFSYTYDLTNTMQRTQQGLDSASQLQKKLQPDQRFNWNGTLVRNLDVQPDQAHYFVTIMLGFVSVSRMSLNGKQFEYALISRRSCENAGTRFFVRGADSQGNVANFVETEQIIIVHGEQEQQCMSFVQIRGSIPVLWSQKPNLKYKPLIELNDENEANQANILHKHMNKCVQFYNKNVCVNLINQHGAEGRLEKAFAQMIRVCNMPLVKYEAFDFHKQCGANRWDRLSILINRLATDQDSFGYFSSSNQVVRLQQSGVFRVNCIDCLDRTNVVQGLLAKRIAHIQLISLGLLGENESIEMHAPQFYDMFRNTWADNGDLMSIQYAGTGALKSDFTRCGKRTAYGVMRDGFNSLLRYYYNNFNDGFRQDSLDLGLGNYRVMVNEAQGSGDRCPVAANKSSNKLLVLPVVGLGTLSMFFISMLVPAQTYQEQFAYVFFWGFATLCTLGVMLYFGKELVNSPRLVRTEDKSKNE